MSEKKKITKPQIITPPQPTELPPLQHQLDVMANAFNQLSQRVNLLFVDVKQNTSNNAILKSTIELLEKNVEFNART